ncbi:MAG: trypsin-like peptidase domain-containing protein, partial [Anaerotignum sp.]|nr:trypsin-like peptidase domain-containing protein [Anaerotignum sp.]
MKRIFKGVFLLLIFFTCSLQTAAASSVNVTLNGKSLSFDTAPCIENGRVLVPMRGVLESLGYSVHWQEHTKTVLALKDGIDISLPLNSSTVTVNNEEVTIDVPAKLNGSRTFVPLRFLAEYSGANVQWDSASSTVVIHSTEAEGYKKEDSVVYLQTNKMQGSGAVLSSDGLIATNFHLIEDASTVQFVFNNGQIYQGKTTIVGLDPQRDIALLQIEKSGLTPALISETFSSGDTVTAIGSPHGIRNTATAGIIEGFDQDIISTTAVIAKGSSGGGLFDASDRLIGMTSSYGNGQYHSIPMTNVLQVPQNLSIPLCEMKNYTYTPDAPQNLRFTKKNNYAYVSWSPVYGAEYYHVYTANSENGNYTKLKNPTLKSDIWYWGFPQSFGITINPKKAYYMKVSAVVNGVETP